MALLQAWPLPGDHAGVAIHDYCLYRISPDGLPDPDATYVSASSVEKMSDRKSYQAWNKSFMVARSVQDAINADGIKLARWIAGRAVANKRLQFISKNPYAKINKLYQDPSVSTMSSCSSSNYNKGREDLADMHIPLTDLQLYQCQLQKSDAGQQPEQVYSLEALEQQAAAAWEYRLRGQAVPPELMPKVPDASCPFTITMTNGLDGQEYVVAHYEPAALLRQKHRAAAVLADIFHGRRREVRMSRASAPKSERMVMAGLRIPRRSNKYVHYGRYVGDEGLAADLFSDIAYSALKNAGAMPAVCDNLVFTTLAVTQNYLSRLHAEPQEHPFNFIVWADLLLQGESVMKVGHFWLTAGLAFVPQNGSGLYIDVRLVTHRSEPSIISNNSSVKTAGLEGRYGCALFIKPPVLRRNALEWAKLDWTLAHSQETKGQQLQALVVEQVMHTAVEYEEADEEEAGLG
eukprot:gene12786-12914_t